MLWNRKRFWNCWANPSRKLYSFNSNVTSATLFAEWNSSIIILFHRRAHNIKKDSGHNISYQGIISPEDNSLNNLILSLVKGICEQKMSFCSLLVLKKANLWHYNPEQEKQKWRSSENDVGLQLGLKLLHEKLYKERCLWRSRWISLKCQLKFAPFIRIMRLNILVENPHV